MSDDERSDSSSDSEDLETSGLIATRQKRATAGNLYATLRANLDDEELQKELLAEDEDEDAGDYEGSDKDAGDDDDALESSSDEEDAGPPREGDGEDLEGEKALKKQERAEARKKRKVHDARLKLPAWQKKKRVKLADDVKTEDGSTSERPRKKSERSNWLPTAADAPIRQSGRSLAVANREIVHANLKQSAERSEKQRRVMKDAAEREKSKKRMTEMSQEERLRKCERVERETAREFGRWEREEAERQRLREEALAAKRNRGLDGPVVRYWSGSVMWEGDRIKVRRMSHGSKKVEDVKVEKNDGAEGSPKVEKKETNGHAEHASNEQPQAPSITDASRQDRSTPEPVPRSALPPAQNPPQLLATSTPSQETPVHAPVPWLQGIQEYAAQPEPAPVQTTTPTSPTSAYTPSAPAINGPPSGQLQRQRYTPPTYQPPQVYHGWPPGSHQFSVKPPALPPTQPPPPAVPLIREQALRSLIMLEQFSNLETPAKRTPKYKQDISTLESDPMKAILLPDSYPSFTSEETKYLTSRARRKNNEHPLPPPPAKQRCALTSWPAKFRDPKTGLAYADMHQYRAIQRVLAGGCQWSGLLGVWVGPAYG